jgi:hypothetical protein
MNQTKRFKKGMTTNDVGRREIFISIYYYMKNKFGNQAKPRGRSYIYQTESNL